MSIPNYPRVEAEVYVQDDVIYLRLQPHPDISPAPIQFSLANPAARRLLHSLAKAIKETHAPPKSVDLMPPFEESIASRRVRISDLLFGRDAGLDLLFVRDPGFKARWGAYFREIAREATAAAQEIDPRPEIEAGTIMDLFR